MTRPALIVSLPVVGAIAATLLFVGSECAGLRLFTKRPFTVAEAAADGDAPAMMRQIYGGASPLERYPVQSDVLSGSNGSLLTPLEAAVMANRPAIIDVLERWGVPIDDPERAHLVCLAETRRASDAISVLKGERTLPPCETAGGQD